MSSTKYKIVHKRIHPPEADALADSYAKAAATVLALTDEIGRISTELDFYWEGRRKIRFLDSLRPLTSKSKEYAVNTLQGIEKGFRAILVDVEERVPIYPP